MSTILPLLTSLPILTASWLSAEVATAELRRTTPIVPTHIKQLRTTAPKDMKAAKEKRAAGRAAAKEKRNATSSVVSFPHLISVKRVERVSCRAQ